MQAFVIMFSLSVICIKIIVSRFSPAISIMLASLIAITPPLYARDRNDRTINPAWLPPPVGMEQSSPDSPNSLNFQNKNLSGKKFSSREEVEIFIYGLVAENFTYPESARRRRIEGSVVLAIDVSQNGELLQIVTKSYSSELLKNDAIGQVTSLFPLDIKLKKAEKNIELNLTYSLD